MKIAIISPFYPFRGGLAQLNAHLYTRLSERNEVRAFTFTTLYPSFLFPGKTQFVTEDDSPVVIDSERVLNSINPFSYFTTAQKINKFAPDFLIIPYWMSFLAPAFGTVCRFLNKKTKVVALVHNAIPHERTILDKPFAKYFFNCCDAFITMSELVKQDLLGLKQNANVIYLPHPIYEQYTLFEDKKAAQEKLGLKPDKKTLLFFGLIRDYKGLGILIEAMNKLDDSYQLIIAGESYGSFDKYTQLIEESKFKENIVVLEQYIPDDMVSLLFGASDILVLPYKSATQSGVVALAYQLELPMVATNVGALGSTIKDSDTGVVVDEISPESIAKGIETFFSEGKAQHYLENVRKEKERLSWKNFIHAVEGFLHSL